MTEPRSIHAIMLDCLEHIEQKKRLTPWERAIVAEGHAALMRDVRPAHRPVVHSAEEIRKLKAEDPSRTTRDIAKIVGCSASTVSEKLKEKTS